MRVLGLIPARGGSKRLARKNMQELGGKPLVEWAIDAARASRIFDDLAVSTEDSEIAEFVRVRSVRVIDRPLELAQDDTPSLAVVRHALEASNQFERSDAVVLLQPTSPFRSAEDIAAAYDLYCHTGADAVVSVTDPERDLVFRVGHAGRLREEPGLVVSNGAIYILSTEALIEGHDWFSGITYAYYMSKERSLDIDSALDLAMARAALEHLEAA